MIPGNQTGTSGLMPLVVLNRMEISVNTKASQVMTPTVNKSLVIALERTEQPDFNQKKPILRLAYNYRNKVRNSGSRKGGWPPYSRFNAIFYTRKRPKECFSLSRSLFDPSRGIFLFAAIIRRLPGDAHIVGVTFGYAGGRDLYKFGQL